ncbi:homeobox protein knotted-1-like 7 [Quercus suber]|uniref:Homeobox protein knotted-1-like 7 n=1 Tax=Quercus suber TaxID=58331 RepID=A0AAW0J261_QUESU
MQEPNLGMMGGGGSSGGLSGEVAISGDHLRQLKTEIATHPLYEQLLNAHVSCLRVATPIDQLPLIDAQLAQSHHLLRSYASQHSHSLPPHERQELDNFLAQYLLVLCSFKEQLQQHVRVHAVEAVVACREIENTLQALTVWVSTQRGGCSRTYTENYLKHVVGKRVSYSSVKALAPTINKATTDKTLRAYVVFEI